MINLIIILLGMTIATIGCSKNTSNSSYEFYQVEGGVDGGGGKGVLCDSQLSALDLYEANRNNLTPVIGFNTLDQNLKYFGTRMLEHISDQELINDDNRAAFGDTMLTELNNQIIGKFEDIPNLKRLKLTDDATLPLFEANCSIVQVLIYSPDGKIYRDLEYWNQLSILQQSAFIIHEWLYNRARISQYPINSDESRKAVGLIFSESSMEPVLSPMWNNDPKYTCYGGISGSTQENFEFYIVSEVRNGLSGIALYFRVFKAAMITLRTSTFYPNITIDQFFQSNYNATTLIVENPAMKKSWNLDLVPNSGEQILFKMRAYASDSTPTEFSNMFCQAE